MGVFLIPPGRPKNPICVIRKVIASLARSPWGGMTKDSRATSPHCKAHRRSVTALRAGRDLPNASRHKLTICAIPSLPSLWNLFSVLADILVLAEETGNSSQSQPDHQEESQVRAGGISQLIQVG